MSEKQETKKNTLLDLVIIGAAAAGPAAAIYAARRNLNFVVISKDIGGEVALSGEVENWPGTIHTTGIELAKNFEGHMKSYNAPLEQGFEVTSISQEGNVHIVNAKNTAGEEKTFRTKTIIVATGIHPRELGVPGEKELKGRGVTYCTVCDGPLFRGKVTATIGAGNAGLESALMMADIAKHVYLLTKFPDTKETNGGFPKGENILIDKVKQKTNVTVLYNTETKSIVGETVVEGILYKDTVTGEEKRIDAQGVMVHVGVIPNSDFITCVDKDPAKHIKINILCETSCKGIFAAGDVTNVPYNQIAIATGHGVTAALSAIDYINKWKE